MHYLSLQQIHDGFRTERFTCDALISSYLSRIDALNPKLNAFNQVFEQDVKRDAVKLDNERNIATLGKLSGMAVAIKDETYVHGQVTTNGSVMLKDYVADSTDPVAQRLLDAGALIIGRTNTPEFSTAGVTWSNLWGVSRSPWNTDITCGGSSGGSAIAVATGMASFANGTDIGGSLRIPAAFCGLYGYKPPHGRVPEIAPYNIDTYCHHGLITRTLDDLQFAYPLIVGNDWQDSHSFVPEPTQNSTLDNIANLKVAVSYDLGFYEVAPDIKRALEKSAEALKRLGAKVDFVDIGWDERVIDTAKFHQRAFMGQMLQRKWDKPEYQDKLTSYVKEYFRHVRSLTASDILDANLYLCEMWNKLSNVFRHYDVLLTPTVATTNVPADFDYSTDQIRINGKIVDANKGWFMTYPFNSLGQCPVLAMPNGITDNGIPSSVQVVGRPYIEQSVFTVAKALSETVAKDFYRTVFPTTVIEKERK